MKRRNGFLNYGRLFSEDDGAGGNNTPGDENNDTVDDVDDIIDDVKKEVDYKELLIKQQEQINLLLAEKEERSKKVESKSKKSPSLTLEDLESFYEKKDAQRRVNEKLASYGLTGERLEKVKNLPAEAQQIILDTLKEKVTLPNTRKLGDGKTGGGKGSVNLNSIDDMLNSIGSK